MNDAPCKIPVHVEIQLKDSAEIPYHIVQENVLKYLSDHHSFLLQGHVDLDPSNEDIEHIEINFMSKNGRESSSGIPLWEAQLHCHVFKLNTEEKVDEKIESMDEDVSPCSQTILPTASLQGLWNSLVYDGDIKNQILEYANTAMLFADHQVKSHIISCNRVVLLHGPPGTGKTSLCKALAQKLSIRLSQRYSYTYLLEINAHSLFSKWFSESGKQVTKLFDHIGELVDDPDALVCVLIDEVESLTASRKAAMMGAEPSDAIRVVNALLTQIDNLRGRENVLILTTSNITEAVDIAFVDRADIKQYIGLPSEHARFNIFQSCIMELARVGIVSPICTFQSFHKTKQMVEKYAGESQSEMSTETQSESVLLYHVSQLAKNFSGRMLRKLPFQAHAFFIQISPVSVVVFLEALQAAIERECAHRKLLYSAPH